MDTNASVPKVLKYITQMNAMSTYTINNMNGDINMQYSKPSSYRASWGNYKTKRNAR